MSCFKTWLCVAKATSTAQRSSRDLPSGKGSSVRGQAFPHQAEAKTAPARAQRSACWMHLGFEQELTVASQAIFETTQS